MKVTAIIPAAGQGRRLGAKIPKAYVSINGLPLLGHTLKSLHKAFSFHEILVAAEPSYFSQITTMAKRLGIKNIRTVEGGATRAQSVGNALKACSPEAVWVLVHDAARPLVSRRIVQETIRLAEKRGAAIAALPITSTVKRVKPSTKIIQGNEDRDFLYLAQTPQVFRKKDLERAYQKAGSKASFMTDEASFFHGTSTSVAVALGEAKNIKVTTPEDMELLRHYLSSRAKKG